MSPKKKRTYFVITDEEGNMIEDWGESVLYGNENKAVIVATMRSNEQEKRFKVLRVTLTASPAGWK